MTDKQELQALIEKYNREMYEMIDKNKEKIQNEQKTQTPQTDEYEFSAPEQSEQPKQNEQLAQPEQSEQSERSEQSEPIGQRPIAPKEEQFEPPKVTESQNASFTMPPADAHGTLIIQATTANGAVPVSQATVVISEIMQNGDEHLLYTLQTNEDGATKPIMLATYPESLSQNPEFYGKPYKIYNAKTSKDGFFTVVDKNVPIFANRTSIQKVNLIPLPEGFKGNTVTVAEETETLPVKQNAKADYGTDSETSDAGENDIRDITENK